MVFGNKRQLSKSSIAYIVLGVVLITLMAVVGTSAFLRTAVINVDGAVMYSSEEIIRASGLEPGNNLIFVNPQNVSQKIRDELPFVSTVQVTRVLPDTVLIEIVESIAIASVRFAGDYYVIDSAGRVLARSNDENLLPVPLQGLIEIRGVEIEETPVGNNLKPVFGTETKLQYMQEVLTAMEREGIASDASYLDVSNIVNVFFGYMGRYRVILGGSTNLRPSNLRHNLGRLNDAVRVVQSNHPNTSGILDMSDESGPPKFTPD